MEPIHSSPTRNSLFQEHLKHIDERSPTSVEIDMCG